MVKDSLAPIPVLILESASIKSKILKINYNVFSIMSFFGWNIDRIFVVVENIGSFYCTRNSLKCKSEGEFLVNILFQLGRF